MVTHYTEAEGANQGLDSLEWSLYFFGEAEPQAGGRTLALLGAHGHFSGSQVRHF